MAPTEILARQHLHKFRLTSRELPGPHVELLITARAPPSAAGSAPPPRQTLRAGGRDPCLIEEYVEFRQLGLAVVDGSTFRQRGSASCCAAKPRPAAFPAMTATPIPRTLALPLTDNGGVGDRRDAPRPQARC